MKQLVTYLSIFGAGCAIGVLGTRTYFAKKYKEISDSEIESMKRVLAKREEKTEANNKEKKEAIFPVTEQMSISIDMSPEKAEFYRTRYNTMSSDVLDPSETESPREDDFEQYEIDIDEFDKVHDGYSKVEYAYYMDDGTLVDDADNVIVIGDTISAENIDAFERSDEDVWYIRNVGLKTDYEITKVYGNYGNIIGDEY